MIQCIGDPLPKRRLCEEDIPLSKHIQLRISVEYARGDKLVENADDDWWKECKYDVVER